MTEVKHAYFMIGTVFGIGIGGLIYLFDPFNYVQAGALATLMPLTAMVLLYGIYTKEKKVRSKESFDIPDIEWK